jgi:hypothetical protein
MTDQATTDQAVATLRARLQERVAQPRARSGRNHLGLAPHGRRGGSAAGVHRGRPLGLGTAASGPRRPGCRSPHRTARRRWPARRPRCPRPRGRSSRRHYSRRGSSGRDDDTNTNQPPGPAPLYSQHYAGRPAAAVVAAAPAATAEAPAAGSIALQAAPAPDISTGVAADTTPTFALHNAADLEEKAALMQPPICPWP